MKEASNANNEIFLPYWTETAYKATGMPTAGIKWGIIGHAARVNSH
jgi:hypothetical protein